MIAVYRAGAAELMSEAAKNADALLKMAKWIEHCATTLKVGDEVWLRGCKDYWPSGVVTVEEISFDRVSQSCINIKTGGEWRDCLWFEEAY